MNKRIKNKIRKGKFYHHRGAMAWQHHSYQSDIRTKEIMLCYDTHGAESYWKKWREVKAYMRSNEFIVAKTKSEENNDLPF